LMEALAEALDFLALLATEGAAEFAAQFAARGFDHFAGLLAFLLTSERRVGAQRFELLANPTAGVLEFGGLIARKAKAAGGALAHGLVFHERAEARVPGGGVEEGNSGGGEPGRDKG